MEPYKTKDYHSLNAYLGLLDSNGKIQFGADKEAAKQYFLQHVNRNMVWFHDLEEKFDYLIENDYYDKALVDLYDFSFIKKLFKFIYSFKFRFQSFMGAYKFYTQYALKTNDGKQYLERLEERVAMTALYLANGNEEQALGYAEEIITGRLQPATPTFLASGRAQRGSAVSCFLLSISDNLEDIGRSVNSILQLSKRGGGVAINLTDIREAGSPIKKIEGASSGVVPIMKIYEDSFSYANQLG